MGKFGDNLIVDGTIVAKQGTNPSEVATNAQLSNKVDKVAGKGLSDNNFTEEYIIKINASQNGYKGVLKITDPTPTVGGQYTPVEDGTYPNGLTYTKATDGMTLFIFDEISWIKVANLAEASNSIALPWTAKEYQKSERVLDTNGDLYIAIEDSEVSQDLTSDAFMKNALTDDNIYTVRGVYNT